MGSYDWRILGRKEIDGEIETIWKIILSYSKSFSMANH